MADANILLCLHGCLDKRSMTLVHGSKRIINENAGNTLHVVKNTVS